jgi:hypothetical protein
MAHVANFTIYQWFYILWNKRTKINIFNFSTWDTISKIKFSSIYFENPVSDIGIRTIDYFTQDRIGENNFHLIYSLEERNVRKISLGFKLVAFPWFSMFLDIINYS